MLSNCEKIARTGNNTDENITGRLSSYMDEQWYRNLEQLIGQACLALAKTEERRKRIDRVIRNLQQHPILRPLFSESHPLHREANQETWFHFALNLFSSNTSKTKSSYCSHPGEAIVHRLRKYWHYRLLDLKIKAWKDRSAEVQKYDDAGNPIDMEEWLVAPSEEPDILDELLEWIQVDTDSHLRNTHIRNKPHIHAQLILLRRCFDRIPWADLAEELDVPVSTLANFLEDRCLPLLQKFAIEKGYIEPSPQIPIPPQQPEFQQNLDLWLKNDPTGQLRQTHLKNCPKITAQLVLLRIHESADKLGKVIQAIADEHGIELARLSSFYYRDCKPLLRQFGVQGNSQANQGGDKS